jgi:DNA-directed RNA polymerase specialized sigma24 family protein
MGIDCDYYFLTGTAREIWQKGDKQGENRMLTCLYTLHKEDFFRRVIYKNNRLVNERMTELAESAFLLAWEAFNNDGKAGRNKTKEHRYTWYFFGIFKYKFLRLLQDEQVRRASEAEFGRVHAEVDPYIFEIKKTGMYSPEIQKMFDRLSPDCRQLLTWRYVEELSHDEIARRKEIARDSSIKMISRCKTRFLAILRNGRNSGDRLN